MKNFLITTLCPVIFIFSLVTACHSPDSDDSSFVDSISADATATGSTAGDSASGETMPTEIAQNETGPDLEFRDLNLERQWIFQGSDNGSSISEMDVTRLSFHTFEFHSDGQLTIVNDCLTSEPPYLHELSASYTLTQEGILTFGFDSLLNQDTCFQYDDLNAEALTYTIGDNSLLLSFQNAPWTDVRFGVDYTDAIPTLIDRKWRLTLLRIEGNEQAPPSTHEAYIQFAKNGTFGGVDSCNNFNGVYDATSDNQVTFGRIFKELAYCGHEFDALFQATLLGMNAWTIDQNRLELAGTTSTIHFEEVSSTE